MKKALEKHNITLSKSTHWHQKVRIDISI